MFNKTDLRKDLSPRNSRSRSQNRKESPTNVRINFSTSKGRSQSPVMPRTAQHDQSISDISVRYDQGLPPNTFNIFHRVNQLSENYNDDTYTDLSAFKMSEKSSNIAFAQHLQDLSGPTQLVPKYIENANSHNLKNSFGESRQDHGLIKDAKFSFGGPLKPVSQIQNLANDSKGPAQLKIGQDLYVMTDSVTPDPSRFSNRQKSREGNVFANNRQSTEKTSRSPSKSWNSSVNPNAKSTSALQKPNAFEQEKSTGKSKRAIEDERTPQKKLQAQQSLSDEKHSTHVHYPLSQPADQLFNSDQRILISATAHDFDG